MNLRKYGHIPGPYRFHHFYEVDEVSGCWLWLGHLLRGGYGHFVDSGKRSLAHRYSWELHNGPIPNEALVCHTCDTPHCVNPAHLFLGSPQSNMDDKVSKRRHYHGEDHWCNKLTEDQVREIRDDFRKQKEIAKDYGVSPQTVSAIKTGTRWRHI